MNKIAKTKQKGIANVPMIMQLEALECGAACLTMLMAYYGKWTALEEVRVECGVSRDGVKATNILKAGRHYGLEAHGYKYEVDELKQQGSFPCIIHWEFNHFVLLTGFKGKYAYINDPARGKVKVPMEQFDTSFTGIVLEFAPSSNFVANGKKSSVISFAKKRLASSVGALAFMVIMTLICSLIGLMQPLFSKVFVDSILSNNQPQWFLPFILIFSGFCLLQIIIQAFISLSSLKIQGKLSLSGSSSLMWKLLHMPIEFFSQRHVADLQNRKNDNATVATTLIAVLAPSFINIGMMIFYLVVMIKYNWILTLIGVASILINSIMGVFSSKRRNNIAIVQLRDKGLLDAFTINSISIIETIKASGAESSTFAKWAGHQANLNNDEINSKKIEILLGGIPLFISSLINVVISVVGAYFIMNGEFTVGMILAFQGLFTAFVAPVNEIIESGQVLIEMRTQMERIEDVINYPVAPVFKEDSLDFNKTFDKINGDIEIKNITFGYSRLEEPLIKNFSLTIKQGSKVALVGSSGCGKSTLGKLLSGLYAPWEGTITFDGRELKEIDKTEFTNSLAVVNQDITIFEDTVTNNITLWNKTIEDYQVRLAAKDASIYNEIMSRDNGFSQKLIEGGRNFSGGERQRIEIARALALEPNILIMDEATSALDAKTESDVVNAIERRGITTIIVAHRLSTIRTADEIIVMDHGSIVERGTHKELMEKGGLYCKLVTSE